MGTRWPKPIQDSPDKRRWYRKYMRELCEMQGEPYNPSEADELYEELLWEEHWDFWIPVKQGRKTVGFFTICPVPHCAPNVDYLLRDAYIHPKYRRSGTMKKAILRWLRLYPGVYEVLVLNDNKPAYHCWRNVFEEAGYAIAEEYQNKERSGADSTLFRFQCKEESPFKLYWHPRRENLYLEYRKEMDDMQELQYDEKLYKADLLDFIDETKNEWIPIVHNHEEVGFICMCAPPCCHPDADWFLREAYVRPEYRCKGLMKNTLLNFLNTHPGRYCLFVQEDNIPANNCWHNIFGRAGYTTMELRQLDEFKDVSVPFYGFKPKEE